MARVLRTDVSLPEGPAALLDGSWIVTEMGSGLISHVSGDGRTKRQVASTGRPNGLRVDAHGSFWVAESKSPGLLKVTADGTVTVVSTGRPELPFLWPNDLCFGPDGAIYMTDSGCLVRQMEHVQQSVASYNVPVDGRVFRVDPETGATDLLDRGLRLANGIAFGPGGSDLYVSETLTGDIYRYEICHGRMVGARQFFSNVMLKPPIEYGRLAGPDGMAFDANGNLYVAVFAQGDIAVVNQDGGVRERLRVDGTDPTNLAFGLPRDHLLLVTECSKNQLLLFEGMAEGLPLYP